MASDQVRCAGKCAAAWIAALACLWLSAPHAVADEPAAQGRQIVEKWQDAVITVRLVVKVTTSYGGTEANEREVKSDANGTVIAPNGLTVVSLTNMDPGEIFKRVRMPTIPGMPSFNVDTQITDVKLRLADGTEVPAKVILRDKDLDLAFVRPTEELPQPFAAVDLAQSAAPQLLDQVVTLNRLAGFGDWAIAPRVDRIQAIIPKPRTLYVPQGGDEVGTPAFSVDGRLIGITLLRLPSSAEALSAAEDLGAFAVILPAADVLEVAKQAQE